MMKKKEMLTNVVVCLTSVKLFLVLVDIIKDEVLVRCVISRNNNQQIKIA